ncbi:GyrI-like domain-containing protein [Phocaeicola sp.]
MEKKYCQSCGMPMDELSIMGTNEDLSLNDEFCNYCFQQGHFTKECAVEDMIQHNMQYLAEYNSCLGAKFSKEVVAERMRKHLPTLKRWKKPQTDQHHNEAVNKVIDYINEHLYETIDIQKLSELTNISTFHFHRLFKAFIGENIGTYIQRIRIENIAHKLINTSLTLSQIAEQTCYENKYALSKAFKKHFGVPPSVYKQSPLNYTSTSFKKEFAKIDLQPTIQDIKDFHIIYFSVNQTDRNQLSYINAWNSLKQFVQKNLSEQAGQFISVSFDDNQITNADKCRYYIGYKLSKTMKPHGKYGVMNMKGSKYAIFRHYGSYSLLETIYANIYNNWLPNSTYTLYNSCSFEIYIHTPDKYEEKDLITDIYIPIK